MDNHFDDLTRSLHNQRKRTRLWFACFAAALAAAAVLGVSCCSASRQNERLRQENGELRKTIEEFTESHDRQVLENLITVLTKLSEKPKWWIF